MKATLTSKGQITIPLKIRQRLGLQAGHQLDFDEKAPFLKATKVIPDDAWEKFRALGKNPWPGLTSTEILEKLRGPVDLPPKGRRKRK